MEERYLRAVSWLDAYSKRRPDVLLAAIAVATVIVTLVLAMGEPPAVVYQAF